MNADAPKIDFLVHYPMKGFAGIQVTEAPLAPGQSMPADRLYAIENGPGRFDAAYPKWLPKINYLQLMRNERLATLGIAFDEADHTLTLTREGKQLAKGSLKTKLGRQMIEQFIAAYMQSDLKGPPKIVYAEGHNFTDIAAKALHIVNLATIRDLGRIAGFDLNPLRFRANVYVDGLPAWEEEKWVGKRLTLGSVTLKVFKETSRCEATSVDPDTAARGISIPSLLERTWGHVNLGVYAEVKGGGILRTGDTITVGARET